MKTSETIMPAEPPAWTRVEVEATRVQLENDITRLARELVEAEEEFGPGFRRSLEENGEEAEMGAMACDLGEGSLVADNIREILTQSHQALQRIEQGRYGVCDTCARFIGKPRMQAFPRATLCLECQAAQERHR